MARVENFSLYHRQPAYDGKRVSVLDTTLTEGLIRPSSEHWMNWGRVHLPEQVNIVTSSFRKREQILLILKGLVPFAGQFGQETDVFETLSRFSQFPNGDSASNERNQAAFYHDGLPVNFLPSSGEGWANSTVDEAIAKVGSAFNKQWYAHIFDQKHRGVVQPDMKLNQVFLALDSEAGVLYEDGSHITYGKPYKLLNFPDYFCQLPLDQQAPYRQDYYDHAGIRPGVTLYNSAAAAVIDGGYCAESHLGYSTPHDQRLMVREYTHQVTIDERIDLYQIPFDPHAALGGLYQQIALKQTMPGDYGHQLRTAINYIVGPVEQIMADTQAFIREPRTPNNRLTNQLQTWYLGRNEDVPTNYLLEIPTRGGIFFGNY